MPRTLRQDYEGAWHHVMNRGTDGAKIFADDVDRRMFLHEMAEACAAQAVMIHAYCQTDNHYHLLVRSESGQLSKAMQQLSARYTQRKNARTFRDGPLFRGRFKSILIEKEPHLWCVNRYVHLNPVRAGLVGRPEHWPWSSAAAYLGCSEAPPWLCTSEFLSMFGSNGRLAYREFLDGGIDEETERFFGSKTIEPVFRL